MVSLFLEVTPNCDAYTTGTRQTSTYSTFGSPIPSLSLKLNLLTLAYRELKQNVLVSTFWGLVPITVYSCAKNTSR